MISREEKEVGRRTFWPEGTAAGWPSGCSIGCVSAIGLNDLVPSSTLLCVIILSILQMRSLRLRQANWGGQAQHYEKVVQLWRFLEKAVPVQGGSLL